MPVTPYTAFDEIRSLSRLLDDDYAPPLGSHATGREMFANTAFLILTDRRVFDPSVDVDAVKTWIRSRLFEDPSLASGGHDGERPKGCRGAAAVQH